MQDPLIRLPERTRLVIDGLAVIGIFLCLGDVVVFFILLFQGELAGCGAGLTAALLAGAALFGAKVAQHEGERRGFVSFLSERQEAESLARTGLRLPEEGPEASPMRPQKASEPLASLDPVPDNGSGAVLILALAAFVAAGAVSLFAEPLSEWEGVKFLATAIAAVPVAAFLAFKTWRALRLARKDLKR